MDHGLEALVGFVGAHGDAFEFLEFTEEVIDEMTPFESIGFYPVSIPLEDGVPGAEQRRQIAPRAAGSRDPQHRLDKAPVILTAATGVGFLPQAMRLHFRPLGIA